MNFMIMILILILTLIHVPNSLCNTEQFENCGKEFECGSIVTNISYPFWGENRPANCGPPGFELTCQAGAPYLTIGTIRYEILVYDNRTQIITVREEIWNTSCPRNPQNITLDTNLFTQSPNTQDLTLLYDCTLTQGVQPNQFPYQFPCTVNGRTTLNFFPVSAISTDAVTCEESFRVRVSSSAAGRLYANPPTLGINQTLAQGFGLDWGLGTNCSQCVESGGRCGFNSTTNAFTCYCSDQAYNRTCGNASPNGGGKKNPNTVALAVGISVGSAALLGLGAAWFIVARKQKKKVSAESAASQTKNKDLPSPFSSNGLTTTTTTSTNFSGSIPSYPHSKNDLEKGSTYFGVQVFSYAELEEATNNFDSARELGDGGFGTVYYGKLQDGRVVAVKRLYENNFKRVEQFMNEVEILTRLRHQYLVKLFGCTSKRSRELLLVYEYIPNGTVADHVHGKRSSSGLLSWPVRLNIAIETADALAYLHASEIIHRDVKTNNILLEADFHVKVADFGLSRLFPTDVTHVSTAPQGTPGYVDPEYYQCYQLTSKSDVYSFGVVLIELISSKQAVDTNRHRHDINLANMAVNKIQNHALHELVDQTLGFETNGSTRRMITMVAELAFRCLQQERDMRPSMEEVLVALTRIKNEDGDEEKAEVLDIIDDDVGLLKANNSPPLSPKSGDTEKLFGSSTTTNSSS